MLPLKKTLTILVLLSPLMFASFEQGHRLYESGNYVEAVPELLEFVEEGKPDERWPQAQKELSECYKQLGIQYSQKKDYKMAVALLYSANTEMADKLMLDTKYAWAVALRDRQKPDSARHQLLDIVNSAPTSDLRDKSLILMMKIELYDLQDEEAALITYDRISNLSGYSTKQKALSMMKELANDYVEKADGLFDDGKYQESLNLYYMVIDWIPSLESSLSSKIRKAKIASFVSQGDKAASEKNWRSAESNYKAALDIDPYSSSISNKLKNATRNRIAQDNPSWSTKWINMIMDQKIAVGMSDEMLVESWGKPDSVYDNYDGTYTWIYYSDPLLGNEVRITIADNKISQIR